MEDLFAFKKANCDAALGRVEVRKSEEEGMEKAEGSHGEGSRGGKVIGHTKSGKPIYSHFEHEGHKNFTKEEHLDAYRIHNNKAADERYADKPETSHESQKREKYHEEQKEKHLQAYEKSGPKKKIKGDLNVNRHKGVSLGNTTEIAGDAIFAGSEIKSLGNLKEIGGNANFRRSEIKSLKNLEKIKGNATFHDSKVTDLGNLKEIGGNANFHGSKVTDLGNLERIEGNADFSSSEIKSLGNLKEIKGMVYFGDNIKLKELWEKRVNNKDTSLAEKKSINKSEALSILGVEKK